MAFYLKRAFGKEKDCFFLNDLRIVHESDTAKIDHLIVTKFGLFIVELKSVYDTIIINKQKEWHHTYNNIPEEGIGSPILQVEAQGKILRAQLRANSEKILTKVMGILQKRFKFCPINVYAAISDNRIINRQTITPELFKADQVTNAIEEKLKYLKKSSSILSLMSNDVAWSVNVEEAKNVADFLLRQHAPLQKVAIKIIPERPEVSAVKPVTVTITKASQLSFVPIVGGTCPKCNQHKLIRKSVTRSDGTETNFLACEAY